jgi:signal peptidase II
VIDKSSKLYILFLWENHQLPIKVLPFFDIYLIINNGVSFSILHNLDYRILCLLSLLSLCLCLVITLNLFSRILWYHILSIALLIGGSLGNLLDRLQYKGVVDFFYLYYTNFSFPVFNVADCFISICGFILILDIFFVNKVNKVS